MHKILINTVLALSVISLASCDGFLNIVPDNVATIDNAFTLRTNAEKYLFTCYSYLPPVNSLDKNPALEGGDEMMVCLQARGEVTKSVGGWRIRNGEQNATTPYCDYWTGANTGMDLYQGIRDCNIFLENIHKVPDMLQGEKDQWINEVKFLKAYYHFYLTRMYGPVPIMDKNLGIDASIEEVHVYRNTLDECFDYIVGLLDEVLASNCLPNKIESEASDLGRITVGIVKAIKAQVLVYAASPLFCGNTDYVGYKDNRGVEIFCPHKTDEEKRLRWEKAAQACKEAIEFLENGANGGHKLYTYDLNEYNASEDIQQILTLRNKFSEPWTSEVIWAYTKSRVKSMQDWALPVNCLGKCQAYQGVLSVPLKITELFYTKNGVPINEDKNWDYDGRNSLRTGTMAERVFMQPSYETVASQYDREYRFYADLAFDGAAWFGNGYTNEEFMAYVNAKNGQTSSNISTAKTNLTGVWPRKYINYKTTVTSSSVVQINYPFPYITMSGLYLYYAEALNEPGKDYREVLPWLDKIRTRAGLKGVEESWTNHSKYPEKFKTTDGLRQIIHQERNIEMIFEGERYWDLRRWKEAILEYNKPLTGWDRTGQTAQEYYRECVVLMRQFDTKDYFSPIRNSEIFANSNTIQNPGW